ncbi:MAG TPA: HlyD family efflux transporter periplasmic adaptor subunit [Gemmatimonadaceae bacterium]|nr:HlyD family efflux transporter periplasmic adaptor subunit [Gemmatimonadaceae bacterium]
MDIARTPKKKRGKYIAIGAGVLTVVLLTLVLGSLPTAAPSVERSSLLIDSVQRGTMVRAVRAPGTLVPERVRIVSALTAGRIEQLPVRPGATVTAGSLLLDMSNPDVQLEALEAGRQVTSAEAALVNLETGLAMQRLAQQAVVASAEAAASDSKRQATVYASLGQQRLVSNNEMALAAERSAEQSARLAAERGRLRVMDAAMSRQIALQRTEVQRARSIAEFQQARVRSMHVLAPEDGVLQTLPLELGQWVMSGHVLATVAQPGRLKAVLRVPETQARDVVIGQAVEIDTRNGLAKGRVTRVDPSVQNGTVTVEVVLDGALPRGARPDLTVDGTIEIERLPNVLHVGRPAYGQSESTVGLFKLDPDGKHATRVPVKLGRTSVNTIQIVQGLEVGDRVIISDMTRWDNVERVKLD